jgi:protein phosphatase
MQELYELAKNIRYTINEIQPDSFNCTGKLVTLPSQTCAVIIGDIHGDFNTLNRILQKTRWQQLEQEKKPFLIFLGDYIDRGPQQLKVVEKVFGMLIKNPEKVILLRGNHEGPPDLSVSPHDFPYHLRKRYGGNWSDAYRLYQEIFSNLYTSTLIEERVLLMHGGIPTQAASIDEIAYAHQTHPEKSTLSEILWNDPSTKSGVHYSYRGIGKMFGSDVSKRFLENIGVPFLIRGHECFDQGYHWNNDHTLTLFSCKLPHYRNSKAAYIDSDLGKAFEKDTISRDIIQI